MWQRQRLEMRAISLVASMLLKPLSGQLELWRSLGIGAFAWEGKHNRYLFDMSLYILTELCMLYIINLYYFVFSGTDHIVCCSVSPRLFLGTVSKVFIFD